MIATPTPPTKEYELIPLMKGNTCLVLEHKHGILTMLEDGHVLQHGLLTPMEVKILEVLLKNYPEYGPYEQVLQAMTGDPIEKSREEVLIALEENTLEWLMRPSRNIIVKIRKNLRPMGIEVKSVSETGYLLVPYIQKGPRNTL